MPHLEKLIGGIRPAANPPRPRANPVLSTAPGGFVQRISSCPCGGGCPRCTSGASALSIQRKPSISAPGDANEREADEVADKVMRMAKPAAIGGAPPTIQRKCGACDEEDKTLVQAKHSPSAHGPTGLDTGAAVRAAGQGGVPLSTAMRAHFEPRFGHDFSRVLVHTDAEAADAARSVQARAYTFGSDIVFGAGEYAPATAQGQRLLAHELTHVLQQTRSAVPHSRQRDDKDKPAKEAVTSHPRMLARSPEPKTSWWREKAAAVHTAIRQEKNFTTYPDGAYWIINPLNVADRATIMTYLDRGDLEQLLTHASEAAESVPNTKDIADKAALALNATLPAKTSWWGKKVESIRFAIRDSKNFTNYPDGAFWLINPLNDDDRARIMTLLEREELESLFARGAEAMSTGVPHAVDIVAKATDELHRRGFVPRTGDAPAEPLPESDETDYLKDPAYVDNIASAHFDVESREFWAIHINGASVPLNLSEVLTDSDRANFPPEVRAGSPRHAMLQYFYRGSGGLIRPSLYTIALTPNIIDCARQVREALPEVAAMRSLGFMQLEMLKTSLQAAIAGKVVGAVGGRIFARAWRMRGPPGGTGAKQGKEGAESSSTRRVMSDAEAFTQARNARNTMVDAFNQMTKAQREQIAAVTGGVNIETGWVAGGYNKGGNCAEDMVVERLGGDASKIRFSEAIRPRTGQQQKVCLGCVPGKYLKEQFPEGVIFEESGGLPMPRRGQ